MNIQTELRIKKMKEFIIKGHTLEIGIEDYRLTDGVTLDYLNKYNPDILCDLNKDSIPKDEETFDCIVAGEVLEHTLNPYSVVREFKRVLKEEGVLVLSVPNVCSLVSRIKMLFGSLPTYSAYPQDKDDYDKHIVDFNYKTLKKMLKECGFKHIEIVSNGLIWRSMIITKIIPASMGETLIVRAVKPKEDRDDYWKNPEYVNEICGGKNG